MTWLISLFGGFRWSVEYIWTKSRSDRTPLEKDGRRETVVFCRTVDVCVSASKWTSRWYLHSSVGYCQPVEHLHSSFCLTSWPLRSFKHAQIYTHIHMYTSTQIPLTHAHATQWHITLFELGSFTCLPSALNYLHFFVCAVLPLHDTRRYYEVGFLLRFYFWDFFRLLPCYETYFHFF